MKKLGMVVKVNTVVVPGVNDHHIEEIAARLAGLKVDLMSCIPMLPVAGTPFADLGPPQGETMARIQRQAGTYLPQMLHCVRCRADAVGLLEKSSGAL